MNGRRTGATARQRQQRKDLEERLAKIQGLPAAARRAIVVAAFRPIPPPAPAWVVDLEVADRNARRDLREIAARIVKASVAFDTQLAEVGNRYGQTEVTPIADRILNHLVSLRIAAMENQWPRPLRPSTNIGRPKEHARRALVWRVAEVFERSGLEIRSGRKTLFGRVVTAVIFEGGAGDVIEYTRVYGPLR